MNSGDGSPAHTWKNELSLWLLHGKRIHPEFCREYIKV